MTGNRLQRVTHGVADRAAAEAFYRQAFGATPFFRGQLKGPDREASLIQLADVRIELTAPPPLPDRWPAYVDRFGGIFSSLTIEVDDLAATGARLERLGVPLLDRGPHRVRIDPLAAHGVPPFELTDIGLPAANLRGPEAAKASAFAAMRSWTIGLIVDRLERAAAFFEAAIGVVPLRSQGRHRRRSVRFYRLGDNSVSLVQPEGPDDPMTAVMERLGPCIHSVGFHVPDVRGAMKALQTWSVGARDSRERRQRTGAPLPRLFASLRVTGWRHDAPYAFAATDPVIASPDPSRGVAI